MSRTRRKIPHGVDMNKERFSRGHARTPVHHNTDGWVGEDIWSEGGKRGFKKARTHKDRQASKRIDWDL